MKTFLLFGLALLLCGCGGGSSSSDSSVSGAPNRSPVQRNDTGAPKEIEKFTDAVFRVPAYPGAEHVAYTSLEMDTDAGHTYARHFTSPDDIDKVETFIKTEGEKVAKYSDPMKGVFNEKLIRNGIFEFSDGGKLVIKLTRDEKGGKTDIMYNYTEPKKKGG